MFVTSIYTNAFVIALSVALLSVLAGPASAQLDDLGSYTDRIHLTNGDTITVVKDGHLTALDDPEVIAMAERYGDPDSLLAEAWIPPVPGISLPGDYWKDYAPDPNAWLLSNDRASGEGLR